jgi:hypothetical protein
LIDLAHERLGAAALARAGGALAARLAGDEAARQTAADEAAVKTTGEAAVKATGEAAVKTAGAGALPAAGEAWAPASGAAQEWVEALTARLPAAAAFAVLEHLFGVLPLVETFFAPGGAIEEVAAGRRLGALGFCTPTPALGWEAAAVAAEPFGGGGLRLRGEVRLPFPAAEGAVVLARLAGGELRLAWVEDRAAGIERRGARRGGPVRGDAPCWLVLEDAAVGRDQVSRPVSLAPGADFGRSLEAYASVWALAAAITASAGVGALRRAVRTTVHGGQAWSTAQLVALDITAVEIEAELIGVALRGHFALAREDAARAGGPAALALAAAAAGNLAAVGARTAELRDLAGIAPGGPFAAAGAARTLTAFLGGALMLERELGRALGIPDHAAAPRPAAAGAA